MSGPLAHPIPIVRRATPADASEIARLRSELILSAPMDAEWLAICTEQLAERLADENDAVAYVVDALDGGLASCALALIHRVLPAAKYPKGLAARIHAVATAPDYRRRGYATAVVKTVVEHLAAHGCTLFELYASDGSAPLYRAVGFESDPAAMRMTRFSTGSTVPL
ncbi:GNAT family N-acetyltransferase [Kitasatospora sp. NPDC004614]|uniref:GNAT family N-acetyltransferase n=1 Tax=unclassified Kitasatospora TaxID=2633591 RepID=UPI0036798060